MFMLGLTVAAGSGCGWLSSPQDAATDRLDEAEALFEKASQGYVAASAGEGEQAPSLSAYRRQTLQQAADPLQAVLDSSGATTSQQQRARRLLAAVRSSQAMAAAERGDAAADRLANLRAHLRVTVNNVRQAAARAGGGQAGQQADEQLQQAIEALRTGPTDGKTDLPVGLQAQRQRIETLSNQIEQKQQRLEEVQSEVQDLREQAKDQLRQAQQARSQAFEADGEEEYDLLQKAARLTGRGNDLSYEADRVALEVDQLERDLSRLKQQRKLARQAVDRLKQKIATFEERAQQHEQAKQAASKAQQRAAAELGKIEQRLETHYKDQVAPAYQEAAQRIGEAVTLMKQAVNAADPGERARQQVALLGDYLDQAYILAQHAATARATVSELQAINDAAVLGEAAEPIQETLDAMKQVHQDVVGQLNSTVDAGVQLAGEVSGDQSMTELAQTRSEQLQGYRQRVSGSLAASNQ
jgi:chromosome segregation ATPase